MRSHSRRYAASLATYAHRAVLVFVRVRLNALRRYYPRMTQRIAPRVWLWIVRNAAFLKISCDSESARAGLVADLTATKARPETIEAVSTGEPTEYAIDDSIAVFGFDGDV